MVDNNDPIILEHSIFLTVDAHTIMHSSHCDGNYFFVCSAAGKNNVAEMKLTQFK